MSQFSKTYLEYIAETRKEHPHSDRDQRPAWELTDKEREDHKAVNAVMRNDRRRERKAIAKVAAEMRRSLCRRPTRNQLLEERRREKRTGGHRPRRFVGRRKLTFSREPKRR